jgi:hypothetical protein
MRLERVRGGRISSPLRQCGVWTVRHSHILRLPLPLTRLHLLAHPHRRWTWTPLQKQAHLRHHPSARPPHRAAAAAPPHLHPHAPRACIRRHRTGAPSRAGGQAVWVSRRQAQPLPAPPLVTRHAPPVRVSGAPRAGVGACWLRMGHSLSPAAVPCIRTRLLPLKAGRAAGARHAGPQSCRPPRVPRRRPMRRHRHPRLRRTAPSAGAARAS